MKTIILFAVSLLIGWTVVAGGVIAMFAGDPAVTSISHRHFVAPVPPEEDCECPMYSEDGVPQQKAPPPDAAVPWPV